MKIAFIADVHMHNHRVGGGPVSAGLNARAVGIAHALYTAAHVADHQGAAHMVVAGDLFDTAKPEPQLIAAVAGALQRVQAILLVGNHDQVSDARGDHAMAPLAYVDSFEVVDEPRIMLFDDIELWVLPYLAGSSTEAIPAALARLASLAPVASLASQSGSSGGAAAYGRRRVLACHVGIHDTHIRAQPHFHWVAQAHDAVSLDLMVSQCRLHSIDAAFAGNWHGRVVWEGGAGQPLVAQIGALVPTGWDNPGLDDYGSVLIYDSETNKVVCVEVPGPRFVNVTSEAELDDARLEAGVHNELRVRWTAQPAQAAGAVQALKASGLLGEVRINKDALREKAQTAAAAARSSTTLSDALFTFVSKINLPVDVDRAEVLRDCRALLGLGGAR